MGFLKMWVQTKMHVNNPKEIFDILCKRSIIDNTKFSKLWGWEDKTCFGEQDSYLWRAWEGRKYVSPWRSREWRKLGLLQNRHCHCLALGEYLAYREIVENIAGHKLVFYFLWINCIWKLFYWLIIGVVLFFFNKVVLRMYVTFKL